MAFDLTALAAYTKDNADVLITAAMTGSKTGAIITEKGNVMTGIKTSERIGVLDQDVVFADGDGCGFTAAGDARITQRTLTVGNVKIETSLCVKDLEKKYTQLKMQAGTNPEKIPAPIEQVYVDQRMGKVESAIEVADWQGDTTSGSANLNKYDGFLKLINTSIGARTVNARKGTGTITATTGAATVVGVGTLFTTQAAIGDKIYSGGVLIGTILTITDALNLTFAANGAAAVTGGAYNIVPTGVTAITSVTGVVAANVLAVVDSVIMGIPEAVMAGEVKPIIFMGWDLARLYLMALKNANLFHFTAESDMLESGFNVPGFAIRVEPTPGLSGTNRIVALAPSNMYLGVDLEHEEEELDMWYEKKDDALLSRIRFKRGVQIGFPDEVTQFLLA